MQVSNPKQRPLRAWSSLVAVLGQACLQLGIDSPPVQEHILHNHVVDEVRLLQSSILLRLQGLHQHLPQEHLLGACCHKCGPYAHCLCAVGIASSSAISCLIWLTHLFCPRLARKRRPNDCCTSASRKAIDGIDRMHVHQALLQFVTFARGKPSECHESRQSQEGHSAMGFSRMVSSPK